MLCDELGCVVFILFSNESWKSYVRSFLYYVCNLGYLQPKNIFVTPFEVNIKLNINSSQTQHQIEYYYKFILLLDILILLRIKHQTELISLYLF